MKNIGTLLFLLLLTLANLTAQNKNDANQQREIETQLANQKYKEQAYDEAGEIYLKLFKKYNQQHYLNQYVNCMIKTKQYNNAEKILKEYTRKNSNAWRPIADLTYIYTLNNKKNNADKLIDDIVKDLPKNKNAVLALTTALNMRELYQQSIKILDKAQQTQIDNYNYRLELGTAYQNTGDYKRCFDQLLDHAKNVPEQYDNVKNRIQIIILNDNRGDVTETLRQTLLKRLNNTPDDTAAANMLIWLSLQQQDYNTALDLCVSLDKRNGGYESRIINLANITSNNKQYATAKRGFKYITDKKENNVFYNEALAGLLNTKYLELTENNGATDDFARLANEINKALGTLPANTHSQLIDILARIKAYNLNNKTDAIHLLQETLDKYTMKRDETATLKMTLADIKLSQGEIWDASLLYSQIDKSMKEEPLGHEARFKNARLRYFIGEFAWAEAQLKVLKAATSKLIANDAMSLSIVIKDNIEADSTGNELKKIAEADYEIHKHNIDIAIAKLDSIIATGNNISKPHAIFRKATLTADKGDTQQAEKLYEDVYTLFPRSYAADDALMENAKIAHKKDDSNKAMQLYQKIINEYPTSIYTTEAKRLYRDLQNK